MQNSEDMEDGSTLNTPGKAAYEHYQPAGKETGVFELVSRCRVLEIGFGSGALLRALRERGNDVYGVDAGRDIVEKVRQQGFCNTHLLDVSEEPLPFVDDFFDAAYAYEVFEHLTNPHRMFAELRRVLKPGGVLFFSVPTQEYDMGYGLLRHTFVYPGLLERENLERFIMQMYFHIVALDGPEGKPGLHGYNYVLANGKSPEKMDVIEVITRDCSVSQLYGDLLSPEALRREIDRELAHYARILHEHLLFNSPGVFLNTLAFIAAVYPHEYTFFLNLARSLGNGGRLDAAKEVIKTLSGLPGVPTEVLLEVRTLLQASLDNSPETSETGALTVRTLRFTDRSSS